MKITMTKNKVMKKIASYICVVLSLSIGLVGAAHIFAASQKPINYVCDVRVYQCDSGDDAPGKAKSWFESNGYIYSGIELNPGTKTGKDCYLGYKTTTNKDLAITDIRILPMDTGYQTYDYNSMMDYMLKENYGTAYTLDSAASEFIVNYNAGSPKAINAYHGLNLFYVEEKGKKIKFGDYILAGKTDVKFFAKVVLKASSGTINAVLGFLNVGIAPYNNEYDDEKEEDVTMNWAQKIPHSSIWQMIDEGLSTDDVNDLHKQYNDDAKKLFKQLQDFVTCYENAAARYKKDKNKVLDDTGQETYKKAIENDEDLDTEDNDLAYITAFDTLNSYDFNENMKLGDWLLKMGKQTSDEVDLIQFYPVLEAMSEAQVSISAVGGFLSAASNLSENKNLKKFEDTLPDIKNAIKDYNGGDSLELWDNADDDIENATIAYTSDCIRKQSAMNSLTAVSKRDIVKEYIDKAIEWINIGLGICFVATFVIKLVVMVVAKIAVACACAALTSFCATALAWIAAFSAICFYAGLIVMAVSVAIMIGWWIGTLIRGKVKDLHHTVKPDYVFDAAELPSKEHITVKYKSVLNDEGKVGDINCSKQWRWCLLATTKDTRVGSPIRAADDGSVFKCVTGDSVHQTGYDTVKYFGEGTPADCNAYCEKNNVNGCYVHYRTEASINDEAEQAKPQPEPEPSKKDEEGDKKEEEKKEEQTTSDKTYIGDMIVVTGSSIEAAKSYAMKKKGFNIIDYNLTPDQEHYTYIAYSLTTDKTKAITDIRVAPYAGQTNRIMYGDVEYTYANYMGYAMNIEDEKTAPNSDSLYYTRDEKAGTPISPEGIHFVRKHADAKPGWEPVTLFCGMPYDFDSCYKPFANENLQVLSGRHMNDSDGWPNVQGVFMYYEPEVKYTSGEKYLSGIFFLGGYDVSKTFKMLWAQTTCKIQELKDFMNEDPKTTIYDTNIAHSADIELFTGSEDLRRWMCYTYTYNPKRAIHDIAVYQGTTYSDSLSYSMSKAADGQGNSINYVACSSIEQQNVDTSNHLSSSRFIYPNNTFIDSHALLQSFHDYNEMLVKGYTKTLPERIPFGYSKSDFIPAGLYVAGSTTGKNPIKLSDVVFSKNEHKGVSKENKIISDVSGETTLAGTKASGEFHSIYEMKTPYSTTPFNLTYPTWYKKNDTQCNPEDSLYIYIRDAKKDKGKYISALSVGSYSRKQHKEANSNVSDDEIKAVDAVSEPQAIVTATAGCADEIVMTNLSLDQSDAWYNRQEDGKASKTPPEDKYSAYIGVTRTNDADKAIRGVLLYQNNDKTAAGDINIDGVKYKCASTQTPIFLNNKRYYLYTTTNKGVMPGVPIEEIVIDSNPIKAGYATALVGDAKHEEPYGEPNHNSFIHMKYEHASGEFYNKLYIGKGENKKAALCDLLSQECVEFVDMDLNKDVNGASVYLGYRTARVDWDSVNSQATEKARKNKLQSELIEAVYDVVVTVDEPYQSKGIVTKDNIYYKPVSDTNLNYTYYSSKGSEIYMYFASQYWSSSYNSDNRANTKLPMNVFTGPYVNMAFAPYDRVPYNTSITTTSTGEAPVKWEYVMQSDNSAPANMNGGIAAVDSDGHAKDTRITMFAQRLDGSVKPAGEITGGFVSDTMDVGKVYIEK